MRSRVLAFSLIEVMVGLIIISIVTLSGFQALSAIGIGKVKLIERTQIQEEAYFMSEKLFDLIKKGGVIDYEEYWNRFSYNATQYASGHFLKETAFGNTGTKYYCLSGNGVAMGTGGCLSGLNRTSTGTAISSYSGQYQPYNSYKTQFINYNGDADSDFGNEDTSTEAIENFKGDDDDLFLGVGPEAFPLSSSGVTELYLINGSGTERTYFRWSVKQDSMAQLAGFTCNFGTGQFPTGTGCLGTIQMLKLTGIDEDYDHGDYAGAAIGGYWDDDGEIDTWLIHKDFDPNYSSGTLAKIPSDSYWQDIFPETINVKEVAFYPYPNVDLRYAWRDTRPEIQISPYVQLKMTLEPSFQEKRRITGAIPQVKIATSIQLSELDFQ